MESVSIVSIVLIHSINICRTSMYWTTKSNSIIETGVFQMLDLIAMFMEFHQTKQIHLLLIITVLNTNLLVIMCSESWK